MSVRLYWLRTGLFLYWLGVVVETWRIMCLPRRQRLCTYLYIHTTGGENVSVSKRVAANEPSNCKSHIASHTWQIYTPPPQVRSTDPPNRASHAPHRATLDPVQPRRSRFPRPNHRLRASKRCAAHPILLCCRGLFVSSLLGRYIWTAS